MKTRECDLCELNDRAMRALLRAVGPVGMVRFIRQLRPPIGDYTKDRHKWLDGVSSEELRQEILRDQEDRGRQARPKRTTRKPRTAASAG